MRRLPAIVRIFREASLQHVVERGRSEGLRRQQRIRFGGHNRRHQHGAAFSLKRFAAGEHFVEHDAEREQIGAGVGGFAFDLLGREILDVLNVRALRGDLLLRRDK